MRSTISVIALAMCLACFGCGGEGGGSGGSGGVAGVYVLDGDAMMPAIEKMIGPMLEAAQKMMEALPADERARQEKDMEVKMQERKDEMLKELTLEVHLNEDGSFVAKDKGKTRAMGTWSSTGSAITFTTTEENGKKKDPPEVINGAIDGGNIRFRPDKQMPFDLVLKRK